MFRVFTRLCKLAVLAAATLWCVSAAASQPPAIQALKHFYHDVHTLRTHFHQVQIGDNGDTLQNASGTFYLKRPSRFRWNYEKPYKQSIISDGKTLWDYDKDLQQVTERPVGKALKGTPALLLSGGPELTQAFHIQAEGQKEGLLWVRMEPRTKNSDFKWVRLGFKGSQPRKMILKDNLGQLSRITFSHVQVNRTIDSSRFNFTPPKGTEVVKSAPE